jgi:hypothetical protein
MKHPPHSTLHALFAARSRGEGKPVRSNLIATVLEALYELQRRQAMKVIRAYLRFLGKPNEVMVRAKATQEERGEDR